MNALVHQCAAVLFPSTAPRSLLVIRHGAVPQNAGSTVYQLAEAVRLYGMVKLLNRSVKAILVANSQFQATGVGFLNHELCVVSRKCHRLFYQNVLAAAQAVQRNFSMVAAFGGNGAAVNFLLFECLFIIGVNGRALTGFFLQAVCLLFCPFLNEVTYGYKFHKSIVFRRCINVVFRDSSAANQQEIQFFHNVPILHFTSNILVSYAAKSAGPAGAPCLVFFTENSQAVSGLIFTILTGEMLFKLQEPYYRSSMLLLFSTPFIAFLVSKIALERD